jgi:hypothetical protein
MPNRLQDAAQRYADAVAATDYWRTADAPPHPRWSAAWGERQAALTNLMRAAERLPVSPATRAALSPEGR